MSETEPQPPILIFVRDLMFSTRIVETAKALNRPFKVVRKAEVLMSEQGRLLIVDLNQDGAIEVASEWRKATGARTIGFVSHVDTDVIERAKAAGIDQILSRGQFTQVLPTLL